MNSRSGRADAGTPPRRRLLLVLLAGSLLASIAIILALRPRSVEPRQVLLIIIDTARRDAFGCYGAPGNPTPNVDGIAADGVRFDQAAAASGWTLPSIGTLLTGTWPTVHGGKGKGTRLTRIRPEVPTAAEILRDAGFHTVAFANAAFFSPLLGLDRGFDVFDHVYTFNDNYRRAAETVEAAAAALEESRHRANFLVVHLFDPHLNYGAPAPFTFRFTEGREEPAPPLDQKACLALVTGKDAEEVRPDAIRYVRGLYEGELSYADTQIGRLVKRLKMLGLYDDAMIIVTADHGEEFWDHGGFEHGHTLYDELVHVPLIVKYPKAFVPSRRVVQTQVRTVDVMPTVFDWFGIPGPQTFVGESLTSLVSGPAGEDRIAWVEGTLYGDDRLAVRGSRYKYVVTDPGGAGAKEELYDLIADRGEQENLSAERPEVLLEYRLLVSEHYTALRARVRRWSVPRPVELGPDEIDMLKSLGYLK